MQINCILFDLDGTLINSIPLITWTFEKTFEYFRLPWKNGEVLKTIGIPLKEVADRYMPGRGEEFMEKYTLFQREKHDQYIKLYPDTLETLEYVRASGLKTGVVTSKRRGPALEELEITGLKSYFNTVIAVEDVSFPKPNPEPVLKALDLLNTPPEKAVFIGDSWYDIMAGQQAGTRTIGVTWGMATREELAVKGPDSIIDSWKELAGTLSTLALAD